MGGGEMRGESEKEGGMVWGKRDERYEGAVAEKKRKRKRETRNERERER